MHWWQRPVRIMRQDYLLDLARMRETDLDALARSKKEDWHVNVEWVIGAPGAAPGLGYYVTFNSSKYEKVPSLGDFDVVRSYLPHAHRYGIRVLAYLNMHWYAYSFAEQHPGWEQVLSDGTAYGQAHPLYGGGTTFCVNSPWRDWAFGLIEEAARTGLDGVFLDGPVVFPGCCYCPSCREKFRSRYGADPPEKEDWSDPLWKTFVEFREDSIAEFLRDARTALHRIHPEAVIYLNAGSWHSSGWRVARDIQKVGEFQDFNGAEAFFHPGPGDHILHFSGMTGKYLMAGGKPAVVFMHHALGAWHYIPLPPLEIQQGIVQTVACGANPWFAVFDYALEHSYEAAMEPVKRVQGFLEEQEAYYTNTRSEATVALLVSSQTAHYYVSEHTEMYREPGSGREQDLVADIGTGKQVVDWAARKSICDATVGNAYRGYYLTFTREHIPFDVVLDKDLTEEGLSRYDVLIAPNAACLSVPQIEAIRRFVERGGGLIGSFEIGRYDEKGGRREEGPLGEVFGVQDVVAAMIPATGEEYIKVKQEDPTTRSLRVGQLLPRPVYSLWVQASEEVRVPMVFMNPIGRVYASPKGESGDPALIAHTYGQGRTVYFPYLLGDHYAKYKIHEHQKLIANAVRWVRPRPPRIEIHAPTTVALELRSQNDPPRMLIHLINTTGDMQRPLTEILPILDVEVTLRCDRPSRVHALWSNQDLAFDYEDGTVRCVLPRLDVYEVIVVE